MASMQRAFNNDTVGGQSVLARRVAWDGCKWVVVLHDSEEPLRSATSRQFDGAADLFGMRVMARTATIIDPLGFVFLEVACSPRPIRTLRPRTAYT
jgi:hypothetical protein